jgi:hypothetical protein
MRSCPFQTIASEPKQKVVAWFPPPRIDCCLSISNHRMISSTLDWLLLVHIKSLPERACLSLREWCIVVIRNGIHCYQHNNQQLNKPEDQQIPFLVFGWLSYPDKMLVNKSIDELLLLLYINWIIQLEVNLINIICFNAELNIHYHSF